MGKEKTVFLYVVPLVKSRQFSLSNLAAEVMGEIGHGNDSESLTFAKPFLRQKAE